MKNTTFVLSYLLLWAAAIYFFDVWKLTPSYYDVTFYYSQSKEVKQVKVQSEKEVIELKLLSKLDKLEFTDSITVVDTPRAEYKVLYEADKFNKGHVHEVAIILTIIIGLLLFCLGLLAYFLLD